jgi:hypothetical protein
MTAKTLLYSLATCAAVVILAGCQQDEAAAIPNAKPLDPAVAKKYAGWRNIPRIAGQPGRSKVGNKPPMIPKGSGE